MSYQGSILGQLMFIMFINDLSDSVIYSKICMHADDTALFVSGKSVTVGFNYLPLWMVICKPNFFECHKDEGYAFWFTCQTVSRIKNLY